MYQMDLLQWPKVFKMIKLPLMKCCMTNAMSDPTIYTRDWWLIFFNRKNSKDLSLVLKRKTIMVFMNYASLVERVLVDEKNTPTWKESTVVLAAICCLTCDALTFWQTLNEDAGRGGKLRCVNWWKEKETGFKWDTAAWACPTWDHQQALKPVMGHS